jgi:hypothetical protein
VEASPGDDYWGIGKNRKGENKLGKMLMEIRSELKDVRPEEAVFGVGTGPPPVQNYVEDAEEPGENTEAEDLVEQAAAAVQAGGFRAAGSNPIYMFINSGASVETKSRRARQSGSGRSLAWEGMKEGSQEGGASRKDGDSLTAEGDHAVEVKVEKLG